MVGRSTSQPCGHNGWTINMLFLVNQHLLRWLSEFSESKSLVIPIHHV